MNIDDILHIATAVILGNAVSFAFFMAALKISRLQSQGASEDDLPLWTWLCMIPAPLVCLIGFATLAPH